MSDFEKSIPGSSVTHRTNNEKISETHYVYHDEESNKEKSTEVERALKARHISMLAIGGTIGTGLFISTGNTIAVAGPASSLMSYLFFTTIAYFVTQGLGEMATLIPVSGSFTQFVARWLSPALGAANGWNYWFSWGITFALELSVVGQVIEYWTFAVPLAAWILIFFVILTAFNFFPVKYYGEVEFWIAFMKVIAVAGWIIYAFIMVVGGGKGGPVGFRYWRNPGAFGPGIHSSNKTTGQFLGWLSSLISAAFTFQGCELVGLSCGEAKNPRKTVPSAIRKVLIRILLFYVLSIFFIGLLVPWDDPRLPYNGEADSTQNAASSPFVIAMLNSGTKILPDIFNAVILITIISAGNSNIYSGSRILYGLAQAGIAPKFFMITNRWGVPYYAVVCTSILGSLGYLAVSSSGLNAFNWLLNITALAGLIAWLFISLAHIRFMNILKSRNISRDSLPFKAKFMPYGSYYCAIVVFVLIFIQGYEAFYSITATSFFTSYVSLIIFVVCWLIFHIMYNGLNFSWDKLIVPIDQCDIDSGVREADDEVWEESVPTTLWEKFWAIIN
ncbi:arginine permease [Scheffersomyces spartinae]|uniref:Arginine permease n=1 Tax=Scheffersomyces spartinae TaxID=45513 RepID=A0A9P8AJS0_9ASCO|nr:arginine permease [Scheffersomyces spartinae]KAG7195164.1 arginine permease [Scheffersomyces spartinae]